MATKEKVLRVVEALEGGLFREKKTTVTQEVDDKGAFQKELERKTSYGDLFREVKEGEEPSDRILDEVTYEVRLLAKVEQAPEVLPPPIHPVEEPAKEVIVPPVTPEPPTSSEVVAKEQPAPLAKAKPKKPAAKKAVAKKAKKPVKKVAAKKVVAKKPAKKPVPKKPSSGQSGPPIDDLTYEKLNKKERKVVEALSENVKMTISEIGASCFPHEPKRKQRSWTRNSLRRLVRGCLVEKVNEGVYKATGLGKKRVAQAA